jgi:sugar lactone lactonase YvrE
MGLALAICGVLAIAQNSSIGGAATNGLGAPGNSVKASGATEAIKSDKAVVVVATGIAPRALAIDPRANVFVTNATAPNRIFTLTGLADLAASGGTSPVGTARLALVAGDGKAGSLGDGGNATGAQFDLKLDSWVRRSGIAVSGDGTIFVADTLNATIRRITGSDSSEPGIVRSIAGRWASKQNVALGEPLGLALDRAGNLYLADYTAGAIDFVPDAVASSAQEEQVQVLAHVLAPASLALTTDGSRAFVASPDTDAVFEIETQTRAIRSVSAFPLQKGEGGEAKSACAGLGPGAQQEASPPAVCPAGIAVDGAGNLFVADANAGSILRVDAQTGQLTTAATGLAAPGEIGFDPSGNLYVAEQGANRIVKFVSMGQGTGNLTITMPNPLPPPPAPRVCPQTGPFDFCDEPTGGSTGEQAFTLTNNGSAAVSGLAISFTGANPGDFQATSNTCGTSLAAGASCTINVEFSPTATGARSAVLTVTDTTSANDQGTANVTGTGDDYELTLNGSPMEQSVVQGGTIKFNFNITPDAVFGGDVTIVCPTNLPALSTCTPSASAVTVTPGTAASFSVTFATTYNGITGGYPGNGWVPGELPRKPRDRNGPSAPLAVVAMVTLMGFAAAFARRWSRRWEKIRRVRPAAICAAAALLLVCGIAWLGGCKKHSIPPGLNTPAGSTNLTIQGTAQNAGRGITITLDVVGPG